MPTEQPASAPDAPGTIGTDARDDATAAAVLHDIDAGASTDKTPGSGGLGGATPNSPIDTRTSGTGDVTAAGEARLRAGDDDTVEPHPGSQ